MFGKIKPEFMPPEGIKKLNRPADWEYLSRALRESGDEIIRALDSGTDEEVLESVGRYRRALVETTQTTLGRNAGERDQIKGLERKLSKVAADLNKALIEKDRPAVRATLEALSMPEDEPYPEGKYTAKRRGRFDLKPGRGV